MKKTLVVLLLSLVLGALGIAPAMAQSGADVTTLVAGGSMGSVDSAAAFTSGANSRVNGNVIAATAVTLGADALVTGNVTAGADSPAVPTASFG